MITLSFPFTEEKVRALKVGDEVLISGTVFTGRDAVHKYLHEGGALPDGVSFKDGIIYHCGPVMMKQTDGSYIFRECATPEEEKNLKNAFWSNFRDAKLTEEQKDAFWLKERYGYTIIDISKHLHIPLSTVGDWINKVKHECATHYNRNQYE